LSSINTEKGKDYRRGRGGSQRKIDRSAIFAVKRKYFLFKTWKVSRRFGKVKYSILKSSIIYSRQLCEHFGGQYRAKSFFGGIWRRGGVAHFRSLGKGKDYRRGRSGSQRKINPSAFLSGLSGKKI
jgi:hypothetical protein